MYYVVEKVKGLYVSIMSSQEEADDKEMFVDYVKSMLADCASYVKRVSTGEQRIQLARMRMESDELKDFIKALDFARRTEHDAIMSEIDVTNRLCARFGVELIAPNVTHERRESYGDFAQQVVNEYFATGKAAFSL